MRSGKQITAKSLVLMPRYISNKRNWCLANGAVVYSKIANVVGTNRRVGSQSKATVVSIQI